MKAPDLSSRRVVTPVVLQMEAVECGAAALGMVLGYFGRFVPLAELREACGVSREGSRASSVLRAARGQGLEARGLRCPVEALDQVSLPAIVFWNFHHFVVLEGYRRGGREFFLNDPACGRRTVSGAEFRRNFTGVVLRFAKGADFRKRPAPPGLRGWLWEQAGAAPELVGFLVLCAGLLTIPGLALAGLIRVFVDEVLIGGEAYWRGPLVGGLVLSALSASVLMALMHGALLRWQGGQTSRAADRFLRRLLRQPLGWFSGRVSGEVAGRVLLPGENARLVAAQLIPLLLSALPMMGLAVFLFVYDFRLAVLAAGFSGTGFFLTAWQTRTRSGAGQNLAFLEGELAGAVWNGLRVSDHLQCGGGAGFLRRLEVLRIRILNRRQKQEARRQVAMMGPVLLSALGFAAVVTWGGLHILEGVLTVGGLVAFLILWLQGQFLLQRWLALPGLVRELRGNLMRLDDLPVVPEPENPGRPPGSFEKLEIDGLAVGYDRFGEPVLQDIGFALTPGQFVGLTGASASGKSTLVKALCGLLEPWSGRVLLNGCPVTTRALAACAGVIEQEPVFFPGSVEENLWLGNGGAPLEGAIDEAGLTSVLAARPDGIVRENGANFSGGERQRLEMARVLARPAGLVILDEAWNGLDAGAAARMADGLRRRGVAVFLVSQRRDILRLADEILVLDGGRLVERGGFDELMREGRVFREVLGL